MMSLFYLLFLFFAASSWCLLVPIYGSGYPFLGTIGGISCFICGGIFLWLSFSWIKEVFKQPLSRVRYLLVNGVFLVLFVLIIGVILIPLYTWFNILVHEIPFFDKLCFWFLKGIGAGCSYSNGLMYLQTHEYIIPVRISLELMDGFWLTQFMGLTFAFSLMFGKHKWRVFVKTAIIVATYAVFRLVVVTIIYTNFPDVKAMQFPARAIIFYDPLYRILSFTLIVPLLYAFVQPHKDFDPNKLNPMRLSSINWRILSGVIVLAFIAGINITGFIQYQDPGEPKEGRVFIDDLHSKWWESSTESLGKDDFGGKALYSYNSLVHWLRHFYTVEINSSKPLNECKLNEYDVVILKTPALKYSPEEIKSLLSFVRKGGGLLVIGDHSDLLGMNTYLNEITKHWGLSFNLDSCNALTTGFFSLFRPTYSFPHVIMDGIRKFEFLTSCTIKRPWFGCENVIPAYNILSDPVDYSQRNFFGQMIPSPKHFFGTFALCVAKKVEQGRVVLFSDGTVFSSFCLFQNGRDKFISNTVEYLNRKNKFGYWPNCVMGVVGISAMGIAIVLLMRFPDKLIIRCTVVVLGLAILLGRVGFSKLNAYFYSPQTFLHPVIQAGFLQDGCMMRFPPVIGVGDPDPGSAYNSFYIISQRLGLIPQLHTGINPAFLSSNLIIITNPYYKFSTKQLQQIQAYVFEGGRLLVVDGQNNKESTANQLLEIFGLELSGFPLAISGGNVITLDKNSPIQAVQKTFGKGIIVVAVDSEYFSDKRLGNAMAIPDPFQKMIYQNIYKIFEESLKGLLYENYATQ